MSVTYGFEISTSSKGKQCPSCISLCLVEENSSMQCPFLHLNRHLFFFVLGFSSWGDQNPGSRINFGEAATWWQVLLDLFFLLKTDLVVVGAGGVTTILGSWNFKVPGRSFLVGQLNKRSCGLKQGILYKYHKYWFKLIWKDKPISFSQLPCISTCRQRSSLGTWNFPINYFSSIESKIWTTVNFGNNWKMKIIGCVS